MYHPQHRSNHLYNDNVQMQAFIDVKNHRQLFIALRHKNSPSPNERDYFSIQCKFYSIQELFYYTASSPVRIITRLSY
jgi:hypothetical protein